MWAETLENNGVACQVKGIYLEWGVFTDAKRCELYVLAPDAGKARRILEEVSDSTTW